MRKDPIVLDGMRRVLIGFLPSAASAYANLVRNRGVGTRTVGAIPSDFRGHAGPSLLAMRAA
jgi:hypothetical protein